MFQMIPLSSLSAGRHNPRKVQADLGAHRRLCASIRSLGLLQPLVVLPDGDGFKVKAGKRRLHALRTIHRSTPDVAVSCMVQDVDTQTGDAMALAENVIREQMHPLDEAEAFARLAHVEAKGVSAIAAEFGVEVRYVRQRIQLAALADVVKAAYRDGVIDTATAEVFASVPTVAQAEAWEECGGRVTNHHHAQQLIASDWIDAKQALFDLDTLSAGNSGGSGVVSRDLFSERVMVERKAFFAAQAQAVEVEQDRLLESGWVGVEVIAHNNLPESPPGRFRKPRRSYSGKI